MYQFKTQNELKLYRKEKRQPIINVGSDNFEEKVMEDFFFFWFVFTKVCICLKYLRIMWETWGNFPITEFSTGQAT